VFHVRLGKFADPPGALLMRLGQLADPLGVLLRPVHPPSMVLVQVG